MPDALSDDLLRTASAWFARLRGGDATDEDRLQHEAWLAEDRAHRKAYHHVRQSAEIAARVIAGGISAPADPEAKTWRSVAARSRPAPTRRVIAACLALVAVMAALLWNQQRPQEFFSKIGQLRTITLKDGSVLTLGPATTVSVAYQRTERDLRLERGEALFLIAKSRSRPFIVRAGGRTVKAVGTEFEIDRYGVSVNVAVRHGIVTISKPLAAQFTSPGSVPALMLRRGQAVDYSTGGLIGLKYSIDPGQVGVWRRGLLAYEGAPFARVVSDLNRQFGGKIEIADPKLAALKVTLTLRLQSRNATLRTLERLLPIKASQSLSGAIRFVAAPSIQ